MKSSLLLLAFAAVAFSSCTSAYRTGQTPDDVYYSPGRPQDEYVVAEEKDDRSYRGSDEYYEDRYLRMRVQNRYRWSALDDYYLYPSYAYNYYGSYWNNPYSSYWSWNNYYNPYYPGMYYPGYVIIKNPGNYVRPSRPVAFSGSSYSSNPGSMRASGLNRSYNGSGNTRYNNSNNTNRSSGTFGNSLRKVFSGSGNSNNYNSYRSGNNNSRSNTPTRSYSPSSSSSSSSSGRSSSSGSSGGGSRPAR